LIKVELKIEDDDEVRSAILTLQSFQLIFCN